MTVRRSSALRAFVVIRALINVAFGIYFLRSSPDLISSFRDAGSYALADGAVAFAIAIVLYRAQYDSVLVLLAIADALARIECGITGLIYPSIANSRIVLPLFLAGIGITAVMLGVAGIVWARARRVRPMRDAAEVQAATWPVVVASITLIVFGSAVSFLDAPQRRLLIAACTLTMGATLLVAALRRHQAQPD